MNSRRSGVLAAATLLLIALPTFVPAAAAPPTWTALADTPESGGYGQALEGTGDALYLVKGYSASSAQDFWKYDPVADAWSPMSTSGLPSGTMRNGATLEHDGGDRLYALAGARYSDSDRRAFWQFSFAADAWSQKADTPCAQGAGDATTWSDTDGVLYAMIGSSGHDRCFAKYAPGTNTWTTLANTPAGIDDGASLEWAGGQYLYALRGEYHESSPAVQDFWRYDTFADSWSSMADIPEADGVGDGGSLLWAGDHDSGLAGKIIALGGNAPDETPGYDVYAYDIATDTWSTLPDTPCPVGNFNGNRLGYAGGAVMMVSMTPSSYACGGKGVAKITGIGEGGAPSNSPPTAAFTWSCTDLACDFTDQSSNSDGTIQSWSWDFGGAGTSTAQHPQHTFSGAGTYSVQLTVTDDGSAQGSVSHDVTVSTGGGGQVYINEFEQNPQGSDRNKEWVELYNSGSSAVDVTGWELKANHGTPATVTLSGTVPAGGYLIVTKSGYWLDNSGEWLTLKDDQGTLVDQTPAFSDSSNDGRSQQRTSDGAATWHFATNTKDAAN